MGIVGRHLRRPSQASPASRAGEIPLRQEHCMSKAVGDLKGEGDPEILKAADHLVIGSCFRKLALWASS